MAAKRSRKKKEAQPPSPAPALPPYPIGTMVAYAGEQAPQGWLLCDGKAVERKKFAKLFAAIGTHFGPGTSSETFNLPDLRGRFPLGVDTMGGKAAGRVSGSGAMFLGGSGGSDKHQLLIEEIPTHEHFAATVHTELKPLPGGGAPPAPGKMRALVQVREAGEPVSAPTSPAGGNLEHENMSPFLSVNYIIFAGEA